jgi:TRAP-type mannitol/chloroaromatic compound transport system substrate-binding protein
MTTRRHLLRASAGIGLATSFFGAYLARSMAQQTINLRMQGFLAAASPTHRAFEKWAKDLAAASGGRLNVSTLPAGGAVAPTETITAIGAGILDGHYSSPSFFASRDPAFTLLGDTGASFDDVPSRDAWFQKEGAVALGREVYASYGLHYVDQIYWPSEHIPSRRALNGYADLKGLKIRVPPGMISEVIGRTGAAVVNLPGGEVFNALQSGVLDATDWASPGQNMEIGLYRAAKFSIDASHSMPTTEMSFNPKKWESVPTELQQLMQAEIKKMSAALTVQIKADDAKAIADMPAMGVQVIKWPTAEVAKLRETTKRVQMELGARNAMARKVYDSLYAYQKKLGLA